MSAWLMVTVRRQLHAELDDQLLLAEVVSTGWALLAELVRVAAVA